MTATRCAGKNYATLARLRSQCIERATARPRRSCAAIDRSEGGSRSGIDHRLLRRLGRRRTSSAPVRGDTNKRAGFARSAVQVAPEQPDGAAERAHHRPKPAEHPAVEGRPSTALRAPRAASRGGKRRALRRFPGAARRRGPQRGRTAGSALREPSRQPSSEDQENGATPRKLSRGAERLGRWCARSAALPCRWCDRVLLAMRGAMRCRSRSSPVVGKLAPAA
jgi:hypothetical protein